MPLVREARDRKHSSKRTTGFLECEKAGARLPQDHAEACQRHDMRTDEFGGEFS
jgi:ribosomal protein S26